MSDSKKKPFQSEGNVWKQTSEETKVSALVSRIILDKYAKLPRNGKPSNEQWTVLAGFVAVPTTSNTDQPQLISLATGTKCLGQSQKRPALVVDSHAEVLARRLFNRQLLDEVRLVASGKPSALLSRDPSGLCAWRQDKYLLYLYASRAPCGDCVICDKEDPNNRLSSIGGSTVDSDIHRTGAKPVLLGGQDTHGPGKEYHVTGLLRTKPGRGEPTDSMSCSDKISRWVACGIQSRLVATFLAGPIPLAGLVIGGEVFDESAVRRALIERHSCPLDTLHILAAPTEAIFSHDRRPGAERCSTSLLARANVYEVAVDGRRHGITKKLIETPKAELSVCRRQLLLAFRTLAHDILEGDNNELNCRVKLSLLLETSYVETKARATPKWLGERRRLFDSRMSNWTVKETHDFHV